MQILVEQLCNSRCDVFIQKQPSKGIFLQIVVDEVFA